MRRPSSPTPLTRPWTRRTLLSTGAAAFALAGTRPLAAAWSSALSAPADDAGYAEPDWLVDPTWLMERGDDASVTVVALTPPKDFVAGHIPGAAQVDWSDLAVTDTSDPSIASWQETVQAVLTVRGVAPDDTVVVYDGGTLLSARLWWILDQLGHADKRILNGGLPAWAAAGGELETGGSAIAPAAEPYTGTPNREFLTSMEEVVAGLDDPDVVLVDARNAEEYAAGHIPGAVLAAHPTNAAPEPPKVWKSADELKAMYADLGVTPDKRVVTYCATGVRSAVSYFTLRLIGYPDVSLYPGSWNEWSQHPELPVATGDQP